jgi:hypothetical protein
LSAYGQASGLADLKFGRAQIADSQWNVQACTQTATCQIYSKNPGTVYKIPWTTGQLTWATGDYVAFAATGNGTNPWNAVQYNSSGTQKAVMGTGHIINMGNDYFFFVGNDNNTGQLFSMTQGFANTSGVSWTGTLNPTISQTNTYAANGSTTPLAAGQTAAPPPPAYGTNFTRVTSYEWKTYTAGSQPLPSEQAHEAFDNTNGSKWFGLRSQGAWAVVQFVTDGTYSSTRAIQKIQFVTANDISGRDPTGFKVWGSINGIDWVLISQQAISLPTGRHTESVVYNLSNVTAFSYYKVEFTGVRDGGDAFQVAEIRLIYDIDDPQGTKAGGGIYTPPPLCCGGSASSFNANSTNTAKVLTFVNRTTADSQVHIEQIGTQNVVEVNQSGTKNNYVEYYGNGLSNDINIAQSGNATTQANYVDLRVVGNFNSVDLQQTSTGGTKGIFADVSGNNNSLLVQQKDGGSHYAEITLSGGNKNVDVLQQGSASHMAKVNLSGTPTDLSLTQSGSTQNYYSITHNCTTVGGCAKITVTQGQ